MCSMPLTVSAHPFVDGQGPVLKSLTLMNLMILMTAVDDQP